MITYCVCLFVLFLTLSEAAHSENKENKKAPILETTVKAESHKEKRNIKKLKSSANTAYASEQLLQLQGLQLQRESGPFSASHLELRGERAQRTEVSFFGLMVNNPVSGQIDLNMLPMSSMFSAELHSGAEHSLGGHLEFKFTPQNQSTQKKIKRFAQISAQVGSLKSHSLDAESFLQNTNSKLYLHLQSSSSAGNFEFQPIVLGQRQDRLQRRSNNKQKRQLAMLYFEHQFPKLQSLSLHFLLFSSMHQSGVPGFFTAPTLSLKQEKSLHMASFKLRQQLLSSANSKTQLSFTLSKQLHLRRSKDQQRAAQSSNIEQNQAQIDIKTVFSSQENQTGTLIFEHMAKLSLSNTQVQSSQYSRSLLSFENTFSVKLFKSKLAAAFFIHHFSHRPSLYSGNLQISSQISKNLHSELRLSHFVRVPSLQELYAPSGLVTGNIHLKNEKITELNWSNNFNPKQYIRMNITFFAAQINESIQYVQRNAFEISPINTGSGYKAGLETSFTLELYKWLHFRNNYRYIHSKLKLSEQPIPTIAAHTLGSFLTLGFRKSIHTELSFSYKSPAIVNLYGALKSPLFSKTNLQIYIPLTPKIDTSLYISNIFDQKYNQDLYLLPLPGRLLFFSLTFHT